MIEYCDIHKGEPCLVPEGQSIYLLQLSGDRLSKILGIVSRENGGVLTDINKNPLPKNKQIKNGDTLCFSDKGLCVRGVSKSQSKKPISQEILSSMKNGEQSGSYRTVNIDNFI